MTSRSRGREKQQITAWLKSLNLRESRTIANNREVSRNANHAMNHDIDHDKCATFAPIADSKQGDRARHTYDFLAGFVRTALKSLNVAQSKCLLRGEIGVYRKGAQNQVFSSVEEVTGKLAIPNL